MYTPEDVRKRYGIPVLFVTAGQGKKPIPAFLQAEGEENKKVLLEKAEGKILLCGLSEKEEAAAEAALSGGRFAAAGKQNLAGETVLLVLFYGSARGTGTEHLLNRIRDLGGTVAGAVLLHADGGFLQHYYREK